MPTSTNNLSKEVIDDLGSFSQRLRLPSQQESLLVLLLDNQADLENVLAMAPLLEDRRLTMVLPGRDPVLEGRAHLLRPRFLTYQDQDPALLLAVLTNIGQRGWPGLGSSELADKVKPKAHRERKHLHLA